MMYLGDFTEDSILYFAWSSNNSDGAAITRATNGTISVYKDDGITQSTAGITDTEDFDTVTGVHMVKIDTSADAFYAVGSDYTVVLSAATIDGQTVNTVLAHFSIENRHGEVDVTSWNGTTVSALNDVSAAEVNAQVDTALADYDGPTKTEMDNGFAALNDLTAAQVNAEVDTALADYDGPTNTELNAAVAPLATSTELATHDGKLDTVDTNVDAILVDTGTTIPAQITALNDISAAEVNTEVDTALADYDAPTHTEMTAEFAALNDLSAADVNAEVDTALSDIHLDHLFATTYDATSKPGAADALLNELMEDDAGVTRYTANALEEAPTGGSAPTVGEIADAVWDELTTGHDISGSFGDNATASLSALQDISTDTGTNIPLSIAIVDANVDAILVDTSTTIPAQISGLNNLSAADVNAEVDTALADYDAPTHAEMTSEFAALNDLSAADVNAEVDTALVDIGLDHLLSASVTGTDITDDSIIAQLVSKSATADWDTFDNTTDALEAIRDNQAGADATAIAAAVWDKSTGDHTTGGSFGAEVQSHALSSEISALNDLSAADVNAQVDAALVDIHLDHLLAVDYDPASPPGVATSLLNEIIESDGGISRFTANALEQAPTGTGSGLTPAETAEAVWGAAKASYNAADTFGEEVQLHALSTEISALNDLTAAEVNAEVDTALADYDGPTNAELTAAVAPLATSAALATHDGKLDTVDANVDAILVDTGTDIPAQISGLNNLSAADVNAEVDTALEDIHLDHLLAVDYDPVSKPGWPTALLNELVDNSFSQPGKAGFTSVALEASPSPVTVGNITSTALALFANTDTGEASAAAGSVAELSQADTVSGDVTVGDITQAALAKFVTDDTGEVAATSNSVADLSQGAAAGISEASIWAYASRTLTDYEDTVTIISRVSGSDISVYSKDTWSFTLTNAGLNLDPYENVAFIVKKANSDTDDEAILLVRSDTNLVRIDGEAPTSSDNGSLSNDTTSITVLVAIDETDITKPDCYTWYLKGFDTTTDPDEGYTLSKGNFTIHPPGLHAIA